jgi:hypothetical protein
MHVILSIPGSTSSEKKAVQRKDGFDIIPWRELAVPIGCVGQPSERNHVMPIGSSLWRVPFRSAKRVLGFGIIIERRAL